MENTLSLLTKEQILAKRERRYKDVPIPELGGSIRIRSLKAAEISAWQASMLDPKTGEPCVKRQKQGRERLVAISAVNDNGTLMFSKDDLESLNQIENSIVGRIAVESQKFSGIDQDDYEEILGNSEGTPADE